MKNVKAINAINGPSPCIGNDQTCPCQDGLACHYKDAPVTKAWPLPNIEALQTALDGFAGRSPLATNDPAASFRVNMMRLCPKLSHADIDELMRQARTAPPAATSGIGVAEGGGVAPFGLLVGLRQTPEGTREFFGYVHDGVDVPTNKCDLYLAPPDQSARIAALEADNARLRADLFSARSRAATYANALERAKGKT